MATTLSKRLFLGVNARSEKLGDKLYAKLVPGRDDSAHVRRLGKAELDQIREVAQPGDLILAGNRFSFAHASVYVGGGEIVHAVTTCPKGAEPGVFREPLDVGFRRLQTCRAQVLRLKDATPADREAIVRYALEQQGRPYNFLFIRRTEDAFYCTQLAHAAIQRAENPPEVQRERVLHKLLSVVTAEGLANSPDFDTVWSKNV